MTNGARLSVVRYRPIINHPPFDLSHFGTDPYMVGTFSDTQRRQMYAESCENHDAHAGKYIKSIGGQATDDLQQAQIFGWSRKAKENLAGYAKLDYLYEIIPIYLVPEANV